MNRRDTLKIMAGASAFAYLNITELYANAEEEINPKPINLRNIDGQVHALFASTDAEGKNQIPCDYDDIMNIAWIKLDIIKSKDTEIFIWNKSLSADEITIAHKNRLEVWEDYKLYI